MPEPESAAMSGPFGRQGEASEPIGARCFPLAGWPRPGSVGPKCVSNCTEGAIPHCIQVVRGTCVLWLSPAEQQRMTRFFENTGMFIDFQQTYTVRLSKSNGSLLQDISCRLPTLYLAFFLTIFLHHGVAGCKFGRMCVPGCLSIFLLVTVAVRAAGFPRAQI
jgi:hypothetical protein